MSSETFAYFKDSPAPTRQTDPVLWFKPELDIKWNSRSRFLMRPTVRANPATEETPEQIFLNPAEFYWDIKVGNFRIDIGSNTHNWGVLDGYSPLDTVNGRTLFNPLSSDRRGAPMLDVAYSGDSFKLQTLYIPKQARTLLPSTDSRWLPRNYIVNASALDETVVLPQSFNYYYPGYIELDHALDNNFGAKLSTTWDSLDANFIYFNGMANNTQVSPVFQADVLQIDPLVLQARSDIGILPVYYRTETVGAGLVWAPSDIIYKLETSYARTLERATTLPEWSWQSGIGMEAPAQIGSFSTTTVLQFYYGENKDPAENLVSSSSRIFDRAALIGQRVQWAEGVDSFASVLYDYENSGYLFIAKLNYLFNDHFRGAAELNLLDGDDESILGTYRTNDRAILTLTYIW